MINLTKGKIEKLINIDSDNILYNDEIDRIRKMYRVIENKLYQNDSEEKKEYILDTIFLFLWNKQLTLKNIESKANKGKVELEELNELLGELNKKQILYYNTVLRPKIVSEGERKFHSVSDWGVYIDEEKRKNLINENYLDDYLNEKYSDIMEYFIECLDMISNEFYYMNHEIDVNKYKEYLSLCRKQYEKFLKDNNSYKNRIERNPYLILYIYVRNTLVLKKKLFKISNKEFDLNNNMYSINKNIDIIDEKITSRVIAEALKKIDSKKYWNIDKVIDNIRKCFKKIKGLEKYKIGKEYVFPNLYYPIACYLYYSKKYTSDNYMSSIELIYKIIPIVKASIQGNSEYIYCLKEYIDFLEEQIENIYTSLNYQYQTSALDILSDGIMNLHGLSIGIPKEDIFSDYIHLNECFWE